MTGLLEAYWEAYEAVGLNVFTDYSYLTNVWEHHSQVIEAIADGDIDKGYEILMDHTELIAARPN